MGTYRRTTDGDEARRESGKVRIMAEETSDYSLLLNGMYQRADEATQRTKVPFMRPEPTLEYQRLVVGNLCLVFEEKSLVRLEILDGRDNPVRVLTVEPAKERSLDTMQS